MRAPSDEARLVVPLSLLAVREKKSKARPGRGLRVWSRPSKIGFLPVPVPVPDKEREQLRELRRRQLPRFVRPPIYISAVRTAVPITSVIGCGFVFVY